VDPQIWRSAIAAGSPAPGAEFAPAEIHMSYPHAERLSALDSSFLGLEDPACHMHIGAVALFEAAPLARPDGGIDIDRIRQAMEAGLYRMPRYRQRITRVPVFGQPVWVDDAHFNLAYHVRHTQLPRPGDLRQLKRLVGRIMSQQLDRGKPLWEMWVVEGVEGDRAAIVTKVHHCMIDGVGSVGLSGQVMRPTPDPDPRLSEPPPRWLPRPAPGPLQLLGGEALHRLGGPLATLGALRRAAADPRAAWRSAVETADGMVQALTTSFRPASPSPLNVDIGPHRRFDWTTADLAAIRDVRARLGGTVNDVALAVLSGALRRFLRRRGETLDGVDFRAMIPVNVRTDETRERLGNKVAMVVARLPVDEPDRRRRLERVIAETRAIKRSRQALGVEMLERLSDRISSGLFVQFGRLTARCRPFNLVVTNVPGPQFPVYMLGARMTGCYPLVPLFNGQALGVALFSYDGAMAWGFNADWDVVPDLHDLVDAVDAEMAALIGEAAAVPAPTALEAMAAARDTAA
jgi:WS/DGAT/MGAT family acyltransferase